MTAAICAACGTKYPDRRAACAICEDDRQYVPPDGQQWIELDAFAGRQKVIIKCDDGVIGVGVDPLFAINQRALIVRGAAMSVMWESLSLVTDEAVAAITRDGPIDAIAISHPHFYAAMQDWSDALGGIPIYLHELDWEWAENVGVKNAEFWKDDEFELAPGMTLLRCGGHFPGSVALHWRDARRPAGALLSGDALQVSANCKHVSFMYSYPNAIPMRPEDVAHIRAVLDGYAFDDIYGYTWRRNIVGGARAAVDASFRKFFEMVGRRDLEKVKLE